MRINLNKQPFPTLAEYAKKRPGVWVTVREEQSSANLVTRIRKGEVEDFPLPDFQAKSSRYSTPEGAKYDIEVMYSQPIDDTEATMYPRLNLDMFNRVMEDPEVQEAIRRAISRL